MTKPLDSEHCPCLSLRQPWLWAILHAGKRVENRTWSTGFRGRLLLHAAKGCTLGEWREAKAFIERVARSHGRQVVVPALEEMPRGGIVARAHLVGIQSPRTLLDELEALGQPRPVSWHVRQQYGWNLDQVEELVGPLGGPLFVPYRGTLGLFRVPVSALGRHGWKEVA